MKIDLFCSVSRTQTIQTTMSRAVVIKSSSFAMPFVTPFHLSDPLFRIKTPPSDLFSPASFFPLRLPPLRSFGLASRHFIKKRPPLLSLRLLPPPLLLHPRLLLKRKPSAILSRLQSLYRPRIPLCDPAHRTVNRADPRDSMPTVDSIRFDSIRFAQTRFVIFSITITT